MVEVILPNYDPKFSFLKDHNFYLTKVMGYYYQILSCLKWSVTWRFPESIEWNTRVYYCRWIQFSPKRLWVMNLRLSLICWVGFIRFLMNLMVYLHKGPMIIKYPWNKRMCQWVWGHIDIHIIKRLKLKKNHERVVGIWSH